MKENRGSDLQQGMTIKPSRIKVFCTFRFEAFHCWPAAPDEVAFLRHRHRHEFHVRAEADVMHGNRDIEFILMKRRLQALTTDLLSTSDGRELTRTWSCEQWGVWFLSKVDGLTAIEVSEDGENGARVER